MTRLPLVGFGPKEANECVRLFGPGPDGKCCKECGHLYSHRYAKRYYKCDLRKDTAGAATDHRVGWRACAKFGEVAL